MKVVILTNHAAALINVARQPGSTFPQVASATGITKRVLRKVIADLDNSGYITKKQVGREFRYSLSPDLPCCQDTPQRQIPVWDLLEALGWERERG